MAGAVGVDVLDRLVDRVDDLHGEHEREELRVPVLVLGGAAASATSSSPAAARLRPSTRSSTPSACSARSARGQERPGRVDVHEQRLRRVAHARPLGLGVDDDPLGRLEVRAGIDVDVAVARRGVDHRHRRDALERVLQALAAARDDEVDDPVLGRELRELLAAATGDQGDRALGQAGGLGGVGRDAREHGVRVGRRGGAAQHDGVAGLQAQRGGVDRDVRARLVDDGDHAQRHADLAHVQAVRQPEAVDDLADRVRQRRDRAHAGGDPGDARAVEREAVEERRREAVLAARVHVADVGLEDLRCAGDEGVGDRVQRGVLRGAVERREHPRGVLGGAAEVGDGLGGDGHGERVGGPRPRSQPAPLGLPVALEVVDERRAVEAVRLLARVARHVATEHVERLGGDAQLRGGWRRGSPRRRS